MAAVDGAFDYGYAWKDRMTDHRRRKISRQLYRGYFQNNQNIEAPVKQSYLELIENIKFEKGVATVNIYDFASTMANNNVLRLFFGGKFKNLRLQYVIEGK